ncbi:MAG: hypothetical protein LBH73_03405 [Spirochaetaceae bacterium]|jgi:hypothetical protein|nr:hypothetical protein [Spirochaetaceae bacterium]
MKRLLSIFIAAFFIFGSCDLYDYGQMGNADRTDTFYPGDAEFDSAMSSMSGVWYSHYASIGRLDGFRIGTWEDFDDLVETTGKIALFPDVVTPYQTYTGSYTPLSTDYFVLFDDTVYGQTDDTSPAQGGWGFSYCGIVRAINVFNGDSNRGAIIIEYLDGCAPQWDNEIKNGQRPFFGIYYRRLHNSSIQMANAIDLAASNNGEEYYAETKHLDEAIEKNSAENEAEFISWGVVIPHEQE